MRPRRWPDNCITAMTLVEDCGFMFSNSMVAASAVGGMYFLRALSDKLGKPIDKLLLSDVLNEIITIDDALRAQNDEPLKKKRPT